jgi:glycosyltransferase involved in cell wall biosynthesis
MDIEKVQKTGSDDFKYSVVIPTWNNLQHLQLVIRSIQTNSTFQHQIVVHINDGSDGTYEWVKQQSDIDYTYSEENIGVCYAMNIARSLVKTDYLVYINDDMYVCPEWDLVFDQEIQKIGSNSFFLSCTLIEPVHTNNCTIVRDFGKEVSEFKEQDLLKTYKSFSKKDWSGATWPINIIHIDNWDLVGGYSVEYFPGMYSDPDFSKKLWDSGVRYFKGLGESRAYHFVSKSTTRTRHNNGRRTFLMKWGLTSKTFTQNYLKRGADFNGPLEERVINNFNKLINKTKYILSFIKE